VNYITTDYYRNTYKALTDGEDAALEYYIELVSALVAGLIGQRPPEKLADWQLPLVQRATAGWVEFFLAHPEALEGGNITSLRLGRLSYSEAGSGGGEIPKAVRALLADTGLMYRGDIHAS